MRNGQTLFLLTILLLVGSGCNFFLDITVHDEDEAAELARVFFARILYRGDFREAYDGLHPEFKNVATFDQFLAYIQQIVAHEQGRDIMIFAYETYGADEAINIYARSRREDGRAYYKLTFLGTESKGYSLAGFRWDLMPFPTQGIFREFNEEILARDA